MVVIRSSNFMWETSRIIYIWICISNLEGYAWNMQIVYLHMYVDMRGVERVRIISCLHIVMADSRKYLHFFFKCGRFRMCRNKFFNIWVYIILHCLLFYIWHTQFWLQKYVSKHSNKHIASVLRNCFFTKYTHLHIASVLRNCFLTK